MNGIRNGAGLTPEQLQRFEAFAEMDPHRLLLLCARADYRLVSKGETLFRCGDIDSREFFLLNGEVELRSEDGVSQRINHQHERATRQLARLRPRQFTAVTTRASELVVMDSDIIEQLREESEEQRSADSSYGVSEASSLEELESKEWLSGFQQALKRNQLVLPSLPEVAMKVRRLLEHDNCDADRIASAVNADPAIAAKLIGAANSPIYRGSSSCDTTRNAIVRLGLRTTRQLVVSYAIRDLFATRSPQLKKVMQATWLQSVEVAAISFVIARMIRDNSLPAEEMMLAGLVHEIGVIAILSYLEANPGLVSDEQEVQTILDTLAAEASEAVLRHWKFPADIVEAARQVQQWDRRHGGSADTCDVVQIAKLHSYIWQRRCIPLPRMDQVPAFAKLPLGELTPQLTIRILEEARAQITEVKSLLGH